MMGSTIHDRDEPNELLKKAEGLAVRSVEIVKRLAHESVNAETKRRTQVRKAIDDAAGALINEAQAN